MVCKSNQMTRSANHLAQLKWIFFLYDVIFSLRHNVWAPGWPLDGSRVYSMSLKTRGSSGSLLANSLSLCHHVKKASFRDVMRLRLLSTQK